MVITKQIFKDLFKIREGVIHLKVFWRIILFPIVFIWWFLLQLFTFSVVMGSFAFIFSLLGLFTSFGSLDYKEDALEALDIMIQPILCPFVWLIKYFYLGEFNTLEGW